MGVMRILRERFGWLIVFALGAYALLAQTLLFRQFLSIFEGSEFGIATFFSSWLLWVAVGALLTRLTQAWNRRLSPHLDLLLLLYIPAFLAQRALIIHARELAGIQSYELFAFLHMVPIATFINAPTSLLTGWLFPVACLSVAPSRQPARHDRLRRPVAAVYATEAAGAFVGGGLSTLLLAAGISDLSLFCYTALVICSVVAARRVVVLRQWAGTLIPLPLAVMLLFDANHIWSESAAHQAWQRLLVPTDYIGQFSTSQGNYLYGGSDGQLNVLAWETIVESIPQSEYSADVAALALAQHPDATRILIIGPNTYAIGTTFARFEHITHVALLHPDPHYYTTLTHVLPDRYKKERHILNEITQDPFTFLSSSDEVYDMILLCHSTSASLALNRYSTVEFAQLLKDRLRHDGILCVQFPGDENFIGSELARIGASTLLTLSDLFPHCVLKPGSDAWFIASETRVLTQSSTQLRTQFQSIPGSETVFPPDGILSLYPEDRAAFQRKRYEREIERAVDPDDYRNTLEHPKALLHAMMLAARHQGISPIVIRHIERIGRRGFLWALCAVGLAAILRLAYGGFDRSRGREAMAWLVGTTGFAGFALNLILLYAFQSRFGCLFLYVGLLSALYMLGLTAGALVSQVVTMRSSARLPPILAIGGLASLWILCLILGLFATTMPFVGFIIMLPVCGCAAGIFVPIAATQLQRSGLETQHAARRIDMADHLGGVVGASTVGLLLLPLFGTHLTLILIALLLALPLPDLTMASRPAAGKQASHRWIRLAGLVSIGIAALSLIIAHDVQHEDVPGDPRVDDVFHTQTFSTADLAPEVNGYNGPIHMRVAMGDEGILLDVEVLRHSETPRYMMMLSDWLPQLIGLNILAPDLTDQVDAVTEATVTCDAILETLSRAGSRYARGIRKAPTRRDTGNAPTRTPPTGRPRRANVRKLRAMIERGHLSRKEAEYYHHTDTGTSNVTSLLNDSSATWSPRN